MTAKEVARRPFIRDVFDVAKRQCFAMRAGAWELAGKLEDSETVPRSRASRLDGLECEFLATISCQRGPQAHIVDARHQSNCQHESDAGPSDMRKCRRTRHIWAPCSTPPSVLVFVGDNER